MEPEITIIPLDPNTFDYQTYSFSDERLIIQSELDTVFTPLTDYIEYYVYDLNKIQIYPATTTPLLDYDVREGDVILDPAKNLQDLQYDLGTYSILYTFYRKRLASSIEQKYYISNISSDRTEIRLDSNVIQNNDIIVSTNEFVSYRETSDYFVDFYLNFGNNVTVIANNIKLETDGIEPTVLIKLYEPLPADFGLKSELWVVEELSTPQAYEVEFPFVPVIEDDFVYISGPNYNLDLFQQTAAPSEQFSFNSLLNSDMTSSINQIKSLLSEKEINININYENYANFVNFSSAKTRLENFYYKVGLIESATNELSNFLGSITGDTVGTTSYSSSAAILTSQIDYVIDNFDGYEYFLYFNSGSQYSYPKSTSTPPYTLYSTSSIQAQEWITGSAASASAYDEENRNWLYYSIPEYLREDSQNQKYELFVDMVGQYYDNVWTYTKDLTNKFDADNRLDYGISKDLVADAIKEFAVKLYSNNFNTDDLFTSFLGITPSGSAFPFPYMTGSLPTPSGFEYVDTQISASNDIVPLDDVNKQIYKRIYHNIPYLLKTKGTVAGIRALVTAYGIPDTILRISEFGGKDRNESQDWDLKQNVFNYAFSTGVTAEDYLTSNLTSNVNFGETNPLAIQFRFKPAPIPSPIGNTSNPNIRYSQSLWSTDDGGNLLLEYTGSGFVTGSFPGAPINPQDYYATLKWIPAADDNPSLSASVDLPFFNGDWWSVQTNINGSNTASLYAANNINGTIGFQASSSTSGFDGSYYTDATEGYLNKNTNLTIDSKTYQPFSGSYQELRYWNQEISSSHFFDFVVNPYSVEGNGINSTPNQLFFRADLGTQLNTGSITSIHPRITGSAVQITQSFNDDTSGFTLSSEDTFVTNKEYTYQDQVPSGIKNRVTDKIQSENLILAEAPYGFQSPTSSVPTISSIGNDSLAISAMESIQQSSYVSQSYTPNVNYLEVAFSPSNQVNDDINAQLGYFNMGDFIGDPRFISSSDYSYPNLDALRDSYFEKYMNSYDVVDFVRLIKFFDNSLFKMIKDFTPARTSLASGVVVKQHLLERNRQRPAQVTGSYHVYEGLISNLPKDYSTGSSDFPQYSTQGSSFYKFTGGTGGSFERFNGLQSYPGTPPNNIFGLTQSWVDGNDGSVLNTTYFNQSSSQYISGSYLGPRTWTKDNQSEFYDGIFSGSNIEVARQTLSPMCDLYLNVVDTPVNFRPIFFNLDNDGDLDNVVSLGTFLDQNNVPRKGEAWIGSITTGQSNISTNQQVVAIKLSDVDVNGEEIIKYLDDFESLRFFFMDATIPYNSEVVEYIIEGRTIFPDHALLNISTTALQGNNFYQVVNSIPYYAITSSIQGGSNNWSLLTHTNYTSSADTAFTESSDYIQQGIFLNPNAPTQEQNIFYWNGETDDALGLFNTGSFTETTDVILTPVNNKYTNSAYTLDITPNIPWVISASLAYSASINLNAASGITANGIYHASSSYQGVGLINQNFILPEPTSNNFAYIQGSPLGYSSAAVAIAAPNLTVNSTKFYWISAINTFSGGLSLYANSSLSTNLSLQPGKYFKVSNLNVNPADNSQSYFIGFSSIGGSGQTQLAISDTTPNVTSTLRGIRVNNTKFLPSPLSISLSSPAAFSASYNTQLLGNSNPGITLPGGHPKIAVDGTASLDWYFPSLTLAGTPPTVTPSGPIYQPFSGSTAYTGTPDNTNFANPTFNTSAFYVNTFRMQTISGTGTTASNTLDGAIKVDLDQLANQIEELSPFIYPDIISGIQGNLSFSMNGDSGDDYQVVLKGIAGDDNSVPDWAVAATLFLTPAVSDINGDINRTSITIPVNYDFSIPLGVLTPEPRLFLRLEVLCNDGQVSYTINTFSFTGNFKWRYNSGATAAVYPATYTSMWTSTFFQPNTNTQVPEFVDSGDKYPSAIVDVYLKRSSIEGDFIITGSVWSSTNTGGGYSGSIYSGSVIPFNDGIAGWTGIYNDVDLIASTQSTRNFEQDIYYIEYSMSNFEPGTFQGIDYSSQNIDFQTNSDLSTIYITQSSTGGGGGGDYNLTGSFIFRTSNTNDFTLALNPNSIQSPGDIEFEIPFIIPTETSIGRVELETNYYGKFLPEDIHRFSIGVEKGYLGSGLVINQVTCSISPSQSIWSPLPEPFVPAYDNFRLPEITGLIVPTYFGQNTLPFNLAVDCQPLLNNYTLQRDNPYIESLSYSAQSGSLTPVNFAQVVSGSADRAQVPVSNYTQFSYINPRYNGVKTSAAQLNVWNIGDFGTYGKNPTIELRDAFFGYFNDLDDPYPNINGITRVNLNYLIDEQSNALPPSLNDISIDTFKAVFPNTSVGKMAVNSGNGKYKELGAPAKISRVMEYVTPICYSQNSGNNYSPKIPLSGSGYISKYDNDDENSVIFAQFMAAGTASINTSAPVQSVDYYLNPSETNTSPQGSNSAYTASANNGFASYPAPTWGTLGNDLPNEQIVSLQTSVVTTYVSETPRTRDELTIILRMYTGSDATTESPFNLESIDCKVYTDDGNVTLLKDVTQYGWFNIQNIPVWREVRVPRKRSWRFNKWKWTTVPVPGGGIVCTMDWEMYDTLFDLGLMRERRPGNGSGVQALEWIFTANSGNHTIKVGDQINWRITGEFKGTSGASQQGYFFPSTYPGSYTPVKIQGQGASDYLLEDANTASAPFWVYTGSAGAGTSILDQSILVMSSSNFNEAYGAGFYQGNLPYYPGFSEYFPGGIEPQGTNFDPITSEIELQEGDEIRFGNNENYTYTIAEVFAPQENIEDGGAARLKIRLNSPVPTSVNKDFFLVRRIIPNPNSLYLETPFPYGTLASASISTGVVEYSGSRFALTGSINSGAGGNANLSGSYSASFSTIEQQTTPGILYPDFPTEYLIQSASIIVNDLISRGVITS